MPEVHSPTLLQVHDLPQLHAKPSASSLLIVLETLAQRPFSLSSTCEGVNPPAKQVEPTGVPRYLTSIVSSTLHWIEDEDSREQIWAAASARLSERSGRTAMPSLMRAFEIPVPHQRTAGIQLYEPSLIGDNLGFKTWTSSVLLSRRLASLRQHLPSSPMRVLELGAGTGLLGIAAACAWAVTTTLTDVPAILPNLQFNIDNNRRMIKTFGGDAGCLPLDWSDESNGPTNEDDRYSVILAADPLYSPEHPQMLVDTIGRWMRRMSDTSFIVELPLRDGYEHEREELKSRLVNTGFKIAEEGYENGPEDWQGQVGEQLEVECWWSLWQYKASASDPDRWESGPLTRTRDT